MVLERLALPLKVAYIGCGSYGTNLARAGCVSSAIEPVSCYDIKPEVGEAFARVFEIHQAASLDEILDDPQVEAVIIASPNLAHRENAVPAAAAGKHVFVEKPIANDVRDALSIMDQCKRSGVKLAVGHNARFRSGHRKVKKMIENGDVGFPLGAEANFSHNYGLTMRPDEWRYSRDQCPALPLMQLGVHFVDTIHYFLGLADEVFSYAQRSAIKAENDDSVVSLIRLKNGPLAYVGSYYACPHNYYVHIHGTEGSLYCDGGSQLALRRIDARDYEVVPTQENDTQVAELEDFARAVRTGADPEVGGEAALQALGVVRAAIRSSELSRPVKVDEVLGPLTSSETGLSDSTASVRPGT